MPGFFCQDYDSYIKFNANNFVKECKAIWVVPRKFYSAIASNSWTVTDIHKKKHFLKSVFFSSKTYLWFLRYNSLQLFEVKKKCYDKFILEILKKKKKVFEISPINVRKQWFLKRVRSKITPIGGEGGGIWSFMTAHVIYRYRETAWQKKKIKNGVT